MSKRDEYVAKMKQQLDEANKQVGELEKRFHQASDDVKARYQENLVEMRQRLRD